MQFTSVAWINDHVNKFTFIFKTRIFLYLNIYYLIEVAFTVVIVGAYMWVQKKEVK